MDTKKLTRKLETEKSKLLRQVQEMDCRQITGHDECQGDIADQSQTSESIGEMLRRRRDSLVKIKEIDKTLALIAKGRYGLCELCGKPIPEERLSVQPLAQTHVSCPIDMTKKQSYSTPLAHQFGFPPAV